MSLTIDSLAGFSDITDKTPLAFFSYVEIDPANRSVATQKIDEYVKETVFLSISDPIGSLSYQCIRISDNGTKKKKQHRWIAFSPKFPQSTFLVTYDEPTKSDSRGRLFICTNESNGISSDIFDEFHGVEGLLRHKII